MKDFLNNELNIGDTIVFTINGILKIGKIQNTLVNVEVITSIGNIYHLDSKNILKIETTNNTGENQNGTQKLVNGTKEKI